MRHTTKCGLSALAALALFTSSSLADFAIAGRFFSVRVGRGGVDVTAPGVHVVVGRPACNPMPMKPAPVVLPPDGVPLEIAPPAERVPLPGERPSRPPTIREFIAGYKPTPGKQQIEVVHPFTNAPVKVSFTLPEGNPQRVRLGGGLRRSIEFKYGGKDVEIWFYRNGRVVVRN